MAKETGESRWVLPVSHSRRPAGAQGRAAGRKLPEPCRPSAEASGSRLVGFLTSIEKGDKVSNPGRGLPAVLCGWDKSYNESHTTPIFIYLS